MVEFYTKQLAELFGATVTGVVADPDEGFFGLQLTLPNGKIKQVWFLSDDEGNGPGSFDITDDQ